MYGHNSTLDLDVILKKNNVTNLHANGLHIWREL